MAPFQWYGGKGKLAKWIVPFVAGGKLYCEPFAGAASVFWHKEQHSIEVLNDIDGRIVNLFRVLQDASLFREFAHRVKWTLYSFDEFKKARRILIDDSSAGDIDLAWAFFVSQNQGFGGKALGDGNWGRVLTTTCRDMAQTCSSWRSRISALRHWHDRLTRVQLDNRCALEVIKYWDSKDTVFYVDPPYARDTRSKGARNTYKHECDDTFHKNLVDALLKVNGRVVLSGYDHPMYLPLEESGWEKKERLTSCSAAGRVRGSKLLGKGSAMKHAARTEVLWIKQENNKWPMKLL